MDQNNQEGIVVIKFSNFVGNEIFITRGTHSKEQL